MKPGLGPAWKFSETPSIFGIFIEWALLFNYPFIYLFILFAQLENVVTIKYFGINWQDWFKGIWIRNVIIFYSWRTWACIAFPCSFLLLLWICQSHGCIPKCIQFYVFLAECIQCTSIWSISWWHVMIFLFSFLVHCASVSWVLRSLAWKLLLSSFFLWLLLFVVFGYASFKWLRPPV